MPPVTYTPGVGTKPEDTAWGPYAYGGTNSDGTGGGYQGGFGIQSGIAGTPGGFHGGSQLLQGNGFLGLNQDGAIGAGASVRAAHLEGGYGERGKGPSVSADADAFGAGFDSWVNPDRGASLGAGAYIAQGSVTAGNIGTGARDEEMRFGLSAGVGAAGRLHWGDADGDGRREYGFGADIGPVSFDIKTEDPLMTMAKMTPFGMLAGGIADHFLPKDFNLTESVGNGLSSAGRAIGNGVSSAAGAVGRGVSSAAGAVGRGVSSAAGAAWDGAKAVGSGISSAAGAVGRGVSSAAGAVGSGISSAAGAVGSGLSSAGRAIGNGVSSAAGAVGSGVSSAAGAVGRGLSSAWHSLTPW